LHATRASWAASLPARGLPHVPAECGAGDLPGHQPQRRRLKLHYVGTVKNNPQLMNNTAAAFNLHDLFGRGLARRDRAWALA
jgi:hypothetical protein